MSTAPTTAPNTTSSLPLRIKRVAFNVLPNRWRLPIRVNWMTATGALEPEVRSLTHLVPRGGTALDIGANHGVYSYFMVRHFDRVVAFEPQAACVETLRGWARGRVDIRQVALSDRKGTGQLAIPVKSGVPLTGYARLDAGTDDTGAQVQVAVERLDDQRLEDVRFVKVDVEGHELSVLRGGEALLRRDRPVLLVEIEQRHLIGDRTVADVVGYLAGLGYGCWFRADDRWRQFGAFRVETHQDLARAGKPDYVNMFLFLPDGSTPPAI